MTKANHWSPVGKTKQIILDRVLSSDEIFEETRDSLRGWILFRNFAKKSTNFAEAFSLLNENCLTERMRRHLELELPKFIFPFYFGSLGRRHFNSVDFPFNQLSYSISICFKNMDGFGLSPSPRARSPPFWPAHFFKAQFPSIFREKWWNFWATSDFFWGGAVHSI